MYIKRAQPFGIQLAITKIILFKLYIKEHDYISNLEFVLINTVSVIKVLFVCYFQSSYTRDCFLYIYVSLFELLCAKRQQFCNGLDCFLRQYLLNKYIELDGKNMLISAYDPCWRHSYNLFNSYFVCPQDGVKVIQL